MAVTLTVSSTIKNDQDLRDTFLSAVKYLQNLSNLEKVNFCIRFPTNQSLSRIPFLNLKEDMLSKALIPNEWNPL